jgi:GT2 family glycosyltransferase
VNPLIVIPTLNRPDLLKDCLKAIDRTAPDAAVDVVAFGWDFAAHCNYGATGKGDPIIFLNDDTIPEPGWLESLCAPFSDPRVGIVGCRLTYPDGRLQHAGVYLDTPGGVLTAHNVLTEQPSGPAEAVTGACMAVRRECWDELGGFDTDFHNGYEDVDLCLRARQKAWRVWYTDRATVVHHESQSGPARWSHVRHNIDRLQEKWRGDHQFQ